jgi:hypothetical protein
MYYRYWMNRAHHNVAAHYGVRTKRYKLIYYYYDGLGQEGTEQGLANMPHADAPDLDFEPEWELFDLEKDPMEMNSVYNDPEYREVVEELTAELARLQNVFGDEPYEGG